MSSDCALLLKDVATLACEKIDPANAVGKKYVGLEHIEPESLVLSGYGYAEDVASSKATFKKGDILFGKLRPYFRKVVVAPFDGICSTDIWVVRAKKNVDQTFLYYWIASREFADNATRGSEGTRMPRAKWDYVGRFESPVTDKNEQIAIGQVLKSLDEKIELNRQMCETLEKTASTLFKSWFVDFDPVKAKATISGKGDFAGWSTERAEAYLAHLEPAIAALFPSSFGDDGLPMGWNLGTYGDAMSIYDSKRVPLSKSQRESKQGVFPYYGATSCVDYIDEYLFDGVYLLMGEDGSVIRENGTPFLQYVWGKFWVNNHAHVLQGANGFSTEHLFCGLSSVDVTPYVTGAVQLKINQANMKRISIVVPTKPILSAFSKSIQLFFDKRRLNIQENQTLAEIRDALLPKLLSGEIDVSKEADND